MAAALTNTLHVALPEGVDLAAANWMFARFGEVKKVESHPDDAGKAVIVFYDVRAVARAREALGEEYCDLGPQCGDRAAKLSGTAPFQSDDFEGISAVHADSVEGGSYVLEFFDVRDAARYREQAMGGLELPPGLPSAAMRSKGPWGKRGMAAAPSDLVPPPGLGMDQKETVKAVCKVVVTGLPNKLLSSVMMEAILQQAGLHDDEVVGFSTEIGKTTGEASVSFVSESAANRCIAHFRGCKWDQSGRGVTAKLVHLAAPAKAAGQVQMAVARWQRKAWQDVASSMPAAQSSSLYDTAPQDFNLLALQQMMEVSMRYLSEASSQDVPFSAMSVAAPAWVPTPAALQGAAAAATQAPAFIPGMLSVRELEEATRKGAAAGPARKANGAGSETSTELGDSEDEKDSPKTLQAVAAAAAAAATARAAIL